MQHWNPNHDNWPATRRVTGGTTMIAALQSLFNRGWNVTISPIHDPAAIRLLGDIQVSVYRTTPLAEPSNIFGLTAYGNTVDDGPTAVDIVEAATRAIDREIASGEVPTHPNHDTYIKGRWNSECW